MVSPTPLSKKAIKKLVICFLMLQIKKVLHSHRRKTNPWVGHQTLSV